MLQMYIETAVYWHIYGCVSTYVCIIYGQQFVKSIQTLYTIHFYDYWPTEWFKTVVLHPPPLSLSLPHCSLPLFLFFFMSSYDVNVDVFPADHLSLDQHCGALTLNSPLNYDDPNISSVGGILHIKVIVSCEHTICLYFCTAGVTLWIVEFKEWILFTVVYPTTTE